MEASIEVMKLCESHYPESLRRVFVINGSSRYSEFFSEIFRNNFVFSRCLLLVRTYIAPKIFTFIFAMLKP